MPRLLLFTLLLGMAAATSVTDPAEASAQTVRILFTGSTGEGNADQFLVAGAMSAKCVAEGGCDAVILAGNQFFDDGVGSVTDPRWFTLFESPYDQAGLNGVPFYPVLGNRDYAGFGLPGGSPGSDQAQIDYSALPVGGPGGRFSDKWSMASRFYDVSMGPDVVEVFFLDYAALAQSAAAQSSIAAQVAGSAAAWKLVVGQRPRFTSDDTTSADLEDTAFGVYAALQTVYCAADMYLAGRNTQREFIAAGEDPACPDTHFALSAAGSKVNTATGTAPTNRLFLNDTIEGFAYLEITSTQLIFEFYDKNGTLDFSHTISKTTPGVPAVGLLGLGILASALAAAGALRLKRAGGGGA